MGYCFYSLLPYVIFEQFLFVIITLIKNCGFPDIQIGSIYIKANITNIFPSLPFVILELFIVNIKGNISRVNRTFINQLCLFYTISFSANFIDMKIYIAHSRVFCCLYLMTICISFASPIFNLWRNPWLKNNPWIGENLERVTKIDNIGKLINCI